MGGHFCGRAGRAATSQGFLQLCPKACLIVVDLAAHDERILEEEVVVSVRPGCGCRRGFMVQGFVMVELGFSIQDSGGRVGDRVGGIGFRVGVTRLCVSV